MVLKVSILVVASFAAFAISQVSKKKNTPITQHSEEENMLEQDEGEEIKDDKWIALRKDSNTNILRKRDVGIVEWEKECEEIESEGVKHLQDIEMELEKRKVILEKKMIRLYSLKDQQSCIKNLRRNLDEKNAEINNLSLTVNALKVEIKDIQEEIKHGTLARKQLVMAKKTLEEMQMIRDINSAEKKGQITLLEERLSGFNRCGSSATSDMVEKKLDAVKNIELDVGSMKRRNRELELEKRELAITLVAVNARISKIKESEIIAKVEEEIVTLTRANEDLSKEVERLQKNRFDIVEELVYQRWLSVCLRYEMQDHQTPRKTSENKIYKILDQKPYQRTKPLISEATTDSYSSQTTSTQSEEDDCSTFVTSSSSRSSIYKKFRNGIKMFGKNKGDFSVDLSPNKSTRASPLKRIGLIRRFSTSMVPSKSSMFCKKTVQELDGSPGMLSLPHATRRRRVSFNDVVEILPSAIHHREELSEEGAIDNKEIVSDRPGDMLTAKAVSQHQVEMAGEPEILSPQATIRKLRQSRKSTGKNATDVKEETRKETTQTKEPESRATNILAKESKKNDTHVKLLNAAFIIFILMLLAYSLLSYRIA